MKLLLLEIENQKLYNGFVQGSDIDRDVIARACGFLSGELVATLRAKLEDLDNNKYSLEIKFVSTGEQKIDSSLDEEGLAIIMNKNFDKVSSVISNSRKNKVDSHDDVVLFSEIVKEEANLFSSNSWYEGIVSLKKEGNNEETKEVISSQFESDLGLDGCYGSIQEIHDRLNEESIVELVDWLIDYDESCS